MPKKQKIVKEQNTGNNEDFLFGNDDDEDVAVVKKVTSVLQPKMLPAFFREKTRLLQKLYYFLIVVAVSLAIGITAFVMLDDFAQNWGILSSAQITNFIVMLIFWYLSIASTVAFVWWSRIRAHILKLPDLIASLIPPLVLAATILFLDFSAHHGTNLNDVDQVFLVIGIAAPASAIAAVAIILGNNLWYSRAFGNAKVRTLFTIPGYIIQSAAPAVIWLVGKDLNFTHIELVQTVYSILASFGGIVLLAAGMFASNRFRNTDASTSTNYIRLSGSIPSLAVYTVLSAIGLRFLQHFNFSLPVIIATLIDISLLLLFIAFLIFKGRIINMVHTNPIANGFIIKAFIIAISLTGLILIAMIPKLVTVKSFAPISFGILALTGVTVFIIVTLSHFMNLIVFEQFNKSIIVVTIISMVVILIIVFVLGTLKYAEVIMQFVSRTVCLVFLMAALVAELITTLLGVSYIQKDVLIASHKQKAKKKVSSQKAKEDAENLEQMA